MSSAKRPLWLNWENPDIMSELLFQNNEIDQKFDQGGSNDNAKSGVNMSCITVGRFNESLRFTKCQGI